MFRENEYFWTLWANFYFNRHILNSVKHKLYIQFIKPPSHHFLQQNKTLVSKSLKIMTSPCHRPPLEWWNPSLLLFTRLQFVTMLLSFNTPHSVTAQLSLPVLSIRCSGHNWLTLTPLMLYSDRTLHCTAAHITVQWQFSVHMEIFLPLPKLPPNHNKP